MQLPQKYRPHIPHATTKEIGDAGDSPLSNRRLAAMMYIGWNLSVTNAQGRGCDQRQSSEMDPDYFPFLDFFIRSLHLKSCESEKITFKF